jgi:alkylation response protein AidB-like acyl-CoA dehydrogenase
VLYRTLGSHLGPGPYAATLAAAQWIQAYGDDAAKTRALGPIAEGRLSIAVPATIVPVSSAQRLAGGAVVGRSATLLGNPDAGMAIVPLQDGNEIAWALVELNGNSARFLPQRAWDPTRCLGTLEADGATVIHLERSGAAGAALARAVSFALICDSVGAAGTIYLQTVEYLQTREQFGRPLASFQALKHRAANMHVKHELMRKLAEQASVNEGGDVWPSLVKATVTDAFAFIAADCVQLHGGVGFTWEFDCHLYLKRAKLNQSLVGSNTAQTDSAFHAIVKEMKHGRSALEIAL